MVDKSVKKLSEDISLNSVSKVEHYFPMDRFFLDEHGFLDQIRKVDSLQFLFFNLERVNENYTEHLLLCLPELWEDIEYEDIIKLIENFTNSFSFYTLITFTYKYLEIDLLDEIFYNEKVDDKFKRDCIEYFPRIVATFYLDEDDYMVFDENLMGIHINDWSYTKQRLLVDKRIKPALQADKLSERLRLISESIAQ